MKPLLAMMGLGVVCAWLGSARLTAEETPPAATGGTRLVWAELLTSGRPADLAAFYAAALGWTAEPEGEGSAARIRLENRGRPVGGISFRRDVSVGLPLARWVGFLAADDVAGATARAEAAGAKVLVPARDWPGLGAQAILADPEGATFGLATRPAGAEPEAAAGDWAWPGLLAKDPFAAADFYGALLGCGLADDRRTPLFIGDLLLVAGGRPRAAVMALPGSSARVPGWIWFVRVSEIESVTRRVEKEGGKTLRKPGVDLMGGRLAVVSDPWGAVFGLIEPTGGAWPAAQAASPEPRPSGELEYKWHDPSFYLPWFDPAAVILPEPEAAWARAQLRVVEPGRAAKAAEVRP
jgi:predicted enzyme related to lactoylglutathione lyase